MRNSTLVLALLLAPAALCLAAASGAIGAWDCTAISPDGEALRFTLTIQEENGQLAGTVRSADGETRISAVKYQNSTLTFKVDYQGAPYTLELKVEGDKLAGTYRGEAASGEVKGTRSR